MLVALKWVRASSKTCRHISVTLPFHIHNTYVWLRRLFIHVNTTWKTISSLIAPILESPVPSFVSTEKINGVFSELQKVSWVCLLTFWCKKLAFDTILIGKPVTWLKQGCLINYSSFLFAATVKLSKTHKQARVRDMDLWHSWIKRYGKLAAVMRTS